ncbi:MAG: T9SS type A sorting domain-containing protein [Crocinitomicaceae bacterium]|nr:T9SS type A sorting domain-containing protein [Crocinitomicaceae bacterium]
MKQLLLSIFLILAYQSVYSQVEIYHESDPSTLLNGQEILVTGNPSDLQVKALLFLRNASSNFQEFKVRRERIFATSNEDFLCIGELCLENSNPALVSYQFPVPFQLDAGQSSQFEPGFFPDNQNICGVLKYYILDDKDTPVDSVQVKFLIGVENCNLNVAEQNVFDVNKVKLFPNPAKNSVTVDLGGDFQGHVVLQDALGKVVLDSKLFNRKTLDVSSLQNGLYFATIYHGSSKDAVFTKRLIVKK